MPPGIDEAVAISKVVQFLKSPEYSHFQHIVFDTAPTGHTLRLLTLPDFLDKTIGEQEDVISGRIQAAYTLPSGTHTPTPHTHTTHPHLHPLLRPHPEDTVLECVHTAYRLPSGTHKHTPTPISALPFMRVHRQHSGMRTHIPSIW